MRRLDYSPSIDELVEDHFKSQISQVSNRSISQRPRELLRQKNSSFEFSNDYRSVSQERKNLKTTISRAVNFDLQPWILRNLKPFEEEDAKEKRRDSGTLEQYKVFIEYQEKLEKLLDEFASEEGFDNLKECYEVISRAVKKDRILNKKHMCEIEKVVRRLETEHAESLLKQEQQDRDESKFGDDDDEPVDVDSILTNLVEGGDESNEEEEEDRDVIRKPNPKNKPQIIVFQPMSCDMLVKSLLQIAEYETFANMMKRKALHLNHMRRVENDIRTIAIKARARSKLLSRHVKDVELLCRSFVELKKRMCDLLPQREDMKKQVQSKLDESLFGDIIRDESTLSYAMSLKSMTRFLFEHLSKLCSSSHRSVIEKHTSELLGMIGNEDTKEDDDDEDDRYGNRFARKLLMYGHADVDRIRIEVHTFMKSAFARFNAM